MQPDHRHQAQLGRPQGMVEAATGWMPGGPEVARVVWRSWFGKLAAVYVGALALASRASQAASDRVNRGADGVASEDGCGWKRTFATAASAFGEPA